MLLVTRDVMTCDGADTLHNNKAHNNQHVTVTSLPSLLKTQTKQPQVSGVWLITDFLAAIDTRRFTTKGHCVLFRT